MRRVTGTGVGIAAVVAVVAAALATPGCGGGEDGVDQTGAAGAAGAAGGGGSGGGSGFAQSACGTCALGACKAARDACIATPGCGAWDACLSGCATASGGRYDAACEAACPVPSGADDAKLRGAEKACIDTAPCAECGGAGAGGGGAAGSAGAGGAGAGGKAGAGGASTNPIYQQMCKASAATNACLKCQQEKCCDSYALVYDTPGPTKDFADCYGACKTAACEQGCFDKHKDGIKAFGGYEACVFGLCGAAGDCKISSPCTQCEVTQCKEEYAGCMTDTECFLAVDCIGKCPSGNLSCGNACKAAHPSAATLLDALLVCTAQKCVGSCS